MPAASIIAARAVFRSAECREDGADGKLPATCLPRPGVACTCCELLQVVYGVAGVRSLGDAQLVRLGDAVAGGAPRMPITRAACRPLAVGAIERAAAQLAPALLSGFCASRTPAAAYGCWTEAAPGLVLKGGQSLIRDPGPLLGPRATCTAVFTARRLGQGSEWARRKQAGWGAGRGRNESKHAGALDAGETKAGTAFHLSKGLACALNTSFCTYMAAPRMQDLVLQGSTEIQ